MNAAEVWLTPAMCRGVELIREHGHAWVHGEGFADVRQESSSPSIHRITANRLLRAGIVQWHKTPPGTVMPYLILTEKGRELLNG
jgi:hypothetical protein